jgi:hypothetical protein
MGSSGSGSFSDYSKRKPIDPTDSSGGSSGKDRCGKAFASSLEEVSRCFYFINVGKVPPARTSVKLVFNGQRLAIETTKGEELGYLPTKYNYLKTCLEEGNKYQGSVQISSLKPTPSITVDIVPKK